VTYIAGFCVDFSIYTRISCSMYYFAYICIQKKSCQQYY